jgi:hypothetical protein
MPWTIAFHELAEVEFLALPQDVQAKFERIKTLVDTFGLERIRASMPGTSKPRSGSSG